MSKFAALLLILLVLTAQTQVPVATTYLAAAGNVNPATVGTLLLDLGGAVIVSPMMTGCLLDGSDCNFSGGTVVYGLPDGTWASLGNFTGTAHVVNEVYVITGAASGTDGAGKSVTVQDVRFAFFVYTYPDGTQAKKYVMGSMTLAVN